jgi:hypothetical protein
VIVGDKITWKHWTTWVVQVITIGVVLASWYFVPLFTERQRKEAEVKIWQHTTMSDAHRNLATSLNELHAYTTTLASKYDCDVNDVLGKISEEEFNMANRFILQINTELAIMYMIMPDDKYKTIRDAIKPKQNQNLIELRNNLLIAMRRSQFPDTNFIESNDIRSFDNLKKPSEKTTD